MSATSSHVAYSHQDLITLADWMAGAGGSTAREVADAIAKPWKYREELAQAKADLEAAR